MQCVIIAAGKGTRMMPLTSETPKPLLPVCGKPIITHIVEALPAEITELILVVGYRADQIKAYCGDTFCGRPVTYCEQADFAGGTGDALLCAKPYLRDTFLLMYADDIQGSEALAAVVKEEHAMLAMESDHPEDFGVLELNSDGTLREIIEKPADPPSQLVNIGGFVISPAIFDYVVDVSEQSGELYVTDMVTAYAADHPVKVVTQDTWIPVGRPEDIPQAEASLCPERVESTG